MKHLRGVAVITALLFFTSILLAASGCTSVQEQNMTKSELADAYLNHADQITDYHAEYTLTHALAEPEPVWETVVYDRKHPDCYRMEKTDASTGLPEGSSYRTRPLPGDMTRRREHMKSSRR